MTTLQKIVAAAKKLKKQHPHKYAKWTDYIKAAAKTVKPTTKKSVGNYRINKTEFDETTIPISPRKKTEKKKKVYAVTRTTGGKFKKITRVGTTHTDRGSHNTTIRVVSGIEMQRDLKEKLKQTIFAASHYNNEISWLREVIKMDKSKAPAARAKIKTLQAKYKEAKLMAGKIRRAINK